MNRIILIFSNKEQISIPIQEDFQIETVTEFSSFADMCPTISSLVDLGNAFTSTGGGVSQIGLELRTILDAPRWTKTLPLKIVADLFFYTKTEASKDVVDKVNKLLKLHLLSVDKNKKIRIPGLNATNVDKISENLKNLKKGDSQTGTDTVKKSGIDLEYNHIFSVVIPGVVYIKDAFFSAIQPTYSKHVTEKGFPLWASVNVQIQSLSPGFAEFFEDGKKFYYSRLAESTINSDIIGNDLRGT